MDHESDRTSSCTHVCSARPLRLLGLAGAALCASFALAPTVAGELPGDWWSGVQRDLAASEYEVTWQDRAARPELDPSWQAPNRAHGFRTYFTAQGIRVVPRSGPTPAWQWGLALSAYGRGREAWPVPAASLVASGNRVDYHRGVVEEWYVNSPRGLEQGFVLPAPPEEIAARTGAAVSTTPPPGRGRGVADRDLVHLDLALTGDLDPVFSTDGLAIDFRSATGAFVVHFAELIVTDAAGRRLPAWMEGVPLAPGRGIRIVIDARDASYPVTVDPLATSPAWSAEGNQESAYFGYSVATAGDVDGDGYSDVVVGALGYDGGQVNEGAAFLYRGSASGLEASPAWTAGGGQENAYFGGSVATAGDVDGDGYFDVLVGAYGYDNGETDEGRAFLYRGSASGLAASPSWVAESDQDNAYFGYSVATAGDVDGDGHSDVVIGAYQAWSANYQEGRAYAYLGSASGLASSPAWTAAGGLGQAWFGYSVATAGDVNGDGYADIVVGASNYSNGQNYEGRAFVFLGSATGLASAPGWTAESDRENANLGHSVSTAGDVDGDGYADVIIGAIQYNDGSGGVGRAFVYRGSASGLGASPASVVSATTSEFLGCSVGTAGDVNGDGFADVIIGAAWHSSGGRAYVYLGSASGLSASAAWTAESDRYGAYFGRSVATAGDVNGDGYSDVLVGAYVYSDEEAGEGRAYLYLGSGSGPSGSPGWTVDGSQAEADLGSSVATAGDVNGDGHADVLVGAPYFDNGQADEGRAYVYLGTASGLAASPAWKAEGNQASAHFGGSVATAGDVNGDGFADVVVGADSYDNGQANEGRAYAYLGSASGLSALPAWTAEGDQPDAYFGYSVAAAGDVNGDGYADVVVGAESYSNGQTDEGRVFVYHGSASGLAASSAWTAESNQSGAGFGDCVATAGDVNGDGYADVVVGAPYYDIGGVDEGRVFAYHGSASGLAASPAWTAESDQSGAGFGDCVATTGDVNGDGYADVVIGAPYYDNGEVDEGGASVYLGSSAGLEASPAWTAESDQASAGFGGSVATAGDVNGDGYADVIVGAAYYGNGQPGEGRACVYLGTASGLGTAPAWTAESDEVSASFGNSVGTAGDVNADGYADIIVGARDSDGSLTDAGRASVYYGNGGPGVVLRPRQRRADDAAPIVQGGRSHAPGQFRLASLGRTPFGTGRVKLEWEVKPAGEPFDGAGTSRSAGWTSVGASSASYNELISGLEPGSCHWRVRLLYDPLMSPFAQKSRWFTVPSGGWNEADVSFGSFLGGVAWHDVNRDGIRDATEPPLGGITVRLLDAGGNVLDLRSTDGNGGYRFEVQPETTYRLRYTVPSGWQLTLQDQGLDDTLDSDPNAASGETTSISPPCGSFDVTGWSAGFVQEGPCTAPDEPVYIYGVRHDGSGWAILDFQDPNQPSQVTGYNVYRASSPGAPWPWPLVGSNVRDMDAATANIQWVDQSGDPGTWFYQVNAYSSICNAEGPR